MPVVMATHSRTVSTMVLHGLRRISKIARGVIVGTHTWSSMTTMNSMQLIRRTTTKWCTCITTVLLGVQLKSRQMPKSAR